MTLSYWCQSKRFKLLNAALHCVTKMKPNWTCTVCGMSAGRRYSVERHAKNIHGGQGNAVPFAEYVVGRLDGHYLRPPEYDPITAKQDIVKDKIKEELIKTYAKRVVEANVPPSTDERYKKMASYVHYISSEVMRETNGIMS